MPIEHTVKCWPIYFDAIESGEKPFDVRRDDRGYQKGDILNLQKYDIKLGYVCKSGLRFTTQSCRREITWILTGGQFGIEPGYVVLGLKPPEDGLG
jgi:Domain of unknown function (DUF3850)